MLARAILHVIWKHLKDIVSFSGIIGSLGWNLYNHRENRRLRRDTIRLDEFKRLRLPVDAAYVAIRNHCASLKSLEASGSSPAKILRAVSVCNKALLQDYDLLCDALADLDRSTIVGGQRWVEGLIDPWDQISCAFDAVYAKKSRPDFDLADLREAINRIIVKINLFLTHVMGELDKEIRKE